MSFKTTPSAHALFVIFSHLALLSAQPIFVYDGVSTVNITGQYNWTLKYPLGSLCEDPYWSRTLTVDILAATTEANLIMAFGTSSEYFSVALAYDGKLQIPYEACNCGAVRTHALYVTPPMNSTLRQATTTLEAQYATSTDFRESLINYEDQTTNWEGFGISDDPMSTNESPLILEIEGDRVNDETFLTVTKNGQSETLRMGSTWLTNDDVFLFMGLDAINTEIFTLRGIDEMEECEPTASPTAPTSSLATEPTNKGEQDEKDDESPTEPPWMFIGIGVSLLCCVLIVFMMILRAKNKRNQRSESSDPTTDRLPPMPSMKSLNRLTSMSSASTSPPM